MTQRVAPRIRDIADFLGARGQLANVDEARAAATVRRPASVDQARAGDITFIDRSSSRGYALLRDTLASLVLVAESEDQELKTAAPERTVTLCTPNPRLAFIRILGRFFAPERPAGIHPSAVIAETASVAESAYVGPLVTVGDDASIGERTVIHAGVHVYAGCTIGADCTIYAGAVIGADGFGYERNESGKPERFPHVGTVVIEDSVEIGANACIDRGTLGATVIRSHARIDNLVNIAHNVEVGRGSLIVALTMVSGGTAVGDRSWIAPSSVLRDGISVGEDATVGLGAVVVGDVPAGATVAGNPARELSELKAVNAAVRDLVARRAAETPSD